MCFHCNNLYWNPVFCKVVSMLYILIELHFIQSLWEAFAISKHLLTFMINIRLLVVICFIQGLFLNCKHVIQVLVFACIICYRVNKSIQQISETSSPISLSQKVVDFRKEKAIIQDMAYLTGMFRLNAKAVLFLIYIHRKNWTNVVKYMGLNIFNSSAIQSLSGA